MNRRGRPPGSRTDTRRRILQAARERFLEDGYARTTLRAVARDAGVDVALISYHVGPKHQLFTEALALSASPSMVLRAALAGDPAAFPERLVRAVVRAWEDETTGAALVALVEGAVQDVRVRQLFEEYVDREVVAELTERLGGRAAARRATATVTVVIGLVFSRYVLGLPHATAPDEDETVRTLAPLVRQALRSR